jgi:hypothetical protein
MRVIAPEIFELDPDESFTVRIDSEGGVYPVVAKIFRQAACSSAAL